MIQVLRHAHSAVSLQVLIRTGDPEYVAHIATKSREHVPAIERFALSNGFDGTIGGVNRHRLRIGIDDPDRPRSKTDPVRRLLSDLARRIIRRDDFDSQFRRASPVSLGNSAQWDLGMRYEGDVRRPNRIGMAFEPKASFGTEEQSEAARRNKLVQSRRKPDRHNPMFAARG